jgi:preprotein translocase subunit SecF
MIGLFVGGIFYKKSKRGQAFLYSVEFSGGLQIGLQVESSQSLTSESLAKIFHTMYKKEGISIRHFGGKDFLIRIPLQSDDSHQSVSAFLIGDEIKTILESALPHSQVIITDASFVGPGVGSSLQMKAILSIVIAFLMMFLYVWFRFKSWAFSISNSVSLFHDVLVIVLMILWFDYEISLDIIAAILFILGYSINDTIVVFSRIRENISKHHHKGTVEKGELGKIINISLRETLRRTLLTSAFTTLVVLPLWLWGGVTLEPLSAAILLGIVFGTYSSIGIASPVLYDLYRFL